jgi:hypothetical protein
MDPDSILQVSQSEYKKTVLENKDKYRTYTQLLRNIYHLLISAQVTISNNHGRKAETKYFCKIKNI